MKILVGFNDSGVEGHWALKYLKPGFRHVFCAFRLPDHWITIDPGRGIPEVKVIDGDFDLASYWRENDCTVVETHQRERPPRGPAIQSNCVGLTKGFLCLRNFAVTPYQLYKSLIGEPMLTLPGFGGSPAAPRPLPPPPDIDDPSVAKAAEDLRLSEKRRKGRAALQVSEGGLGDAPVSRPEARKGAKLGGP